MSRAMKTCRMAGSVRRACEPIAPLLTGTSRQPSSRTPSSSITFSKSLSHGLRCAAFGGRKTMPTPYSPALGRSEEHTSELQSRLHLVCRLLLEKKKHHESVAHGRTYLS